MPAIGTAIGVPFVHQFGGVLAPWDQDQIVQWLIGLKADGITSQDRLVPLVVVEPTLVGVNALQFTATNSQYMQTPDLPTGSSSIEFDFETDNVVFGRQFGTSDGANHSFYIESIPGGWTVGYGDSFTSGTTATATGTKCKCVFIGGRLYVNGSQVHETIGSFVGQATQPLWIGAHNASGSIFKPDTNKTYGYKFRESNEIDVIIYIGDSNCSGRPKSWGTLPIELQSEQVAFYSYDVDTNEKPLQVVDEEDLGPLSEVDGWGCEIVAGAEIRRINGRYTAFLKVAQGGSRLYDSWQFAGYMNNRLSSRLTQLISDLNSRGFTTINYPAIWMNLAANDAVSQQPAEEYAQSYDSFHTSLVSSFPVLSGSKVSLVGLQKDTTTSICPYRDTVISQQSILESQNKVTLINTDNIPLGSDDVHWHEDGIQSLGALLAADYLIENSVQIPWDTIANFEEGIGYSVDSSGNSNTLVRGDGATSSTYPTWTTIDGVFSSNHSDGFFSELDFYDTIYAVVDDSEGLFNFGSGDFSIELTLDIDTAASFKMICAKNDTASIQKCWHVYIQSGAIVLGTSSDGATYQTATIPYGGASGRYNVVINKSGTVVTALVDTVPVVVTGSAVGTLFTSATPVSIGTQFNTYPATVGMYSDPIARVKISHAVTSLEYNGVVADTRVVDLSGNGHDATMPNTTGIKRISSVQGDPATAANGLALANHGCGNKYAVHNGSECGILQTDALLLDNLFYSADGITFDRKYIVDYYAAKQWEYNNLIQWDNSLGPCVVVEMLSYLQSHSPSLDAYAKGLDWAQKNTSSCGGGALELAIDVNGNYAIDVNTNYAIAASGD